jgi:hypothetical protein
MLAVFDHLGLASVNDAHDIVSADVAESVRAAQKSGGLDAALERYQELAEASRSRRLDGQELDDLLSLASAFLADPADRLSALHDHVTPNEHQPAHLERSAPSHDETQPGEPDSTHSDDRGEAPGSDGHTISGRHPRSGRRH